jgi:multiple sugar transport system permease protein
MREVRINGLFSQVITHTVLLLGAVVVLAPFVYMLSVAIKPPDEVLSAEFYLWPKNFYGWENFSKALTATPLLGFMLNGLIITASIFFFQVIIALPCAYALAKLRFLGRELLFTLVLLCLLIPPHAVAIPLYLFFHKLGILDTYASLIVPWTISVFGIFLMRQFFKTVPDDLIDAARMDGISEFGIVWRVMLPTAIPALVAFGIFSVVAHWNDYFWPLIVLSSRELYTPPLGVAAFRNEEFGDAYGPLMAAATIVILPLVAAFLATQRKFIEGITLTGMK